MKNLKSELVKEFKKTLKPTSKFYAEDVEVFKKGISTLSKKELQIRLNRLICLNGGNKKFSNFVDKYIDNLDKQGMFK